MSTIRLRLPASLHKQLRVLARQEGISINQFAATALAEKVAVLLAGEHLSARAERGSRSKFEQASSKAPDAKADPEDCL